jgi:threonine/homoserine/homoserine lactone efflux protein
VLQLLPAEHEPCTDCSATNLNRTLRGWFGYFQHSHGTTFSSLDVLTVFALTGSLVFKVFGITLPAFKIAGGIILLLIGIDMLQARRSPPNEVAGEPQEAAEKEDVSVITPRHPHASGSWFHLHRDRSDG